MIPETRVCVGPRVIAVPAMLRAWLVIDEPTVIRVLRRLQKILNQINRIVQKIVVRFADVDVQLSFELRTDPGPITFEDVSEIVILAPVLRDRAIDLPA